jgi:serine/threonine-protein kinase
MAIVYVGQDLQRDRPVAIKVLQAEVAGALRAARFLREIRIAAHLNHPRIVPLYDSGEAGRFLYFTMPYVAAETLRDRLKRETQLAVDEAVQITCEVADALAHAHGRGVVHRDIKPANIMLPGGNAVLADFGLSRAIGEAGGERLTKTGVAIGTPAYMSPEQWLASHKVDGRSDLYSLGCVLYQMLVGEPPFTGPTAQVVMARHALGTVPSISIARPGVPAGIEAAVNKALGKVPDDRYGTVRKFAEALRAQAGPSLHHSR